MSCKSQRVTTVLAFFLIFAVTHVYAGGSFAGSNPGSGGTVAGAPQQASAVLTTRGNKPISVNGVAAITGATIINGSLVDADGVGATINIPGHATLDIASDAILLLEFDQSGNTIRVTLREGCVTLHTKQGTTGEIVTNQGLAGRTDPAKDDVLRVCFPRGAAAPIVDAGGVGAAGGGGGTALSGGAIAAILLGGTAAAVAIWFALRGDNPSPSTP